MRSLVNQLVSVSLYSIRTIPERLGSSASAIVGVMGVVLVLISVLSISQGVIGMVQKSATPESVIVLRGGSNSELTSVINGTEADIILQRDEIQQGPNGALASPELFVILNLPKRSTGTDANVPLRGVTQAAFDVRTIEMVEGRRFQPGVNEVIVGIGAAAEFQGLEVGGTLPVGSQDWEIVGAFESGGGIAEVEVWADDAMVRDAYNRGNSYQAVYLTLGSVDEYQNFKDALSADPRLDVDAVLEEEFYLEQSTVLRTIVTVLGTMIAVIMALGAVFVALNTMYAAVSARTREIATLRALGFGRLAVVTSVLFESLILALIGGLLGAGLAYVAWDGFRAATINFQTFSQISFTFEVTGQLLMIGVALAVFLGFLGGLLPALRAAYLPISSALREL